jgi:lysophospholipid acyltransferase (LPLAT)-like uncharacterized protein
MKALFRAPAVQGALAWLIAAYVGWVTATLRWRVENLGAAREALTKPHGALALFWHGRIAQAMTCLPFLAGRPRRALISLSPDGAFIARAAERIGAPTIRGSTGREGAGPGKGGAAAFRAAVKVLAAGEVVLVTPDGPRGPAEAMPQGPVQLARAARCEAFVLGLAASPALALNSWDRARLPLPFARAVLVIGGPLRAPVRLGETSLTELRLAWREAMSEAQRRAEALLADPAGGPFRSARAWMTPAGT